METIAELLARSDASRLGAMARSNGRPKVPALDSALMALLPANEPVGGIFATLCECWIDGYVIEGFNRLAKEVFDTA